MRNRLFLPWSAMFVAVTIMVFAPITHHAAEPLKYGVVISAMYAGGGNTGATYTHDYIEIFNASNVPVDITGWSVQYANPVSAHWQKTFLPEIALLPGQYLLARQDDGPHGTVTPPADAQGSVGMQGDGSYKVTIVRSRLTIHNHSPYLDPAMQGKIEDFFGGGVANHYEGLPANNGFPTNWTQAWFRHDGGCQDTDNNNNDFYVGPAYPNARSLASPLAPCNSAGSTGTITSTASITPGQQANVTVNDSDLTGSSINITASASNGDTETLTLNGSGGSYTGSFTVANAPANSGNGSLELQSGTITFTYVDALDSGGNTNQNRSHVTIVRTNGANAGTELVVNGGLEDGRTGWTFLAGARRKCSGFGDGSNCGFRLPPQARAEQRGMMGPILDTIDTVAGDVLLVSAAVRTKTANKQRVVMVVVNYIDPAAGAGGHGKDKFKLFVQQATTGYVTFTDNFVLDGEIKGGRVVVANMNGSRPLRVDDISVMLISTEARLGEGDTESRSADGLLPVPAAPDAFRGSN